MKYIDGRLMYEIERDNMVGKKPNNIKVDS